MKLVFSLVARGALTAAIVALAGSCGSSAPVAVTLGNQKVTVVVAVVDSLMPDEITAATPNLDTLKSGGTFYPESRSAFAAETIPNHVAMMTGVYPQRNGIVANSFIDFLANPPVEKTLSLPEELTANTLFTWIGRRCVASGVNPALRTGATLSKKYLFEIFEGDAANPARINRDPDVDNVAPDSHWDPRTSTAYIPAPSEHTPDAPTMEQALTQLPDADFFFVNLGDVDRAAHAGGPPARSSALTDADTQIGRLVDALKVAGRWDNTVLFLVSDHGMDYSLPDDFINVQPMLTALSAGPAPCYKSMTAVDVGGTDSIFVMDASATAAEKQAALRAARACLLGTTPCADLCAGTTRPGNAAAIESAWYTQDDPLDPGGNMPDAVPSKHPNLGGMSLSAAPGFRFSEPSSSSNPIPGNHGHPVTLHNTFLISGGSPWVKKGQVISASVASPGVFDRLPEQSENIDLAPTVAWLLGLGVQPGEFPDFPEHQNGFDGRVLREAFTQFDANPNAPAPSVCGRFD